MNLHLGSATMWLQDLKSYCGQPSFYFVYKIEADGPICPQSYFTSCREKKKKAHKTTAVVFSLDMYLEPLKEGPFTKKALF